MLNMTKRTHYRCEFIVSCTHLLLNELYLQTIKDFPIINTDYKNKLTNKITVHIQQTVLAVHMYMFSTPFNATKYEQSNIFTSTIYSKLVLTFFYNRVFAL